MATFDGNYLVPTGSSDSTVDADDDAPPADGATHLLGASVASGTKSDTQPVDEDPQTFAGNYLSSYPLIDWYFHIHFSALTINLGNLISAQVREVRVWNGHFVPRTLLDVTPADDDGLSLEQPGSLPLVFAPLQEYTWLISVDTDGPAEIAATYTFEFDVETDVVTVTGTRIVAWRWEPNWINPVLERLEWKSTVIASHNAKEQRAQLRGGPRQQWEFVYDVQGQERQRYENILAEWGGRNFALPIWPDGYDLLTPLVLGATTIAVPTAGTDYRADGLGVLIAGGPGQPLTVEAFGIESVADGLLTLDRPLGADWPAGSRIYPARPARMLDTRAFQRYTQAYLRGAALMECVEEIERAAAVEATYRDFPVMTYRPNWREAPAVEYARSMERLDSEVGLVAVDDLAEVALPATRWTWSQFGRAAIEQFRAWAWARAGRAVPIWQPTWADDLTMVSNLASNGVNVEVRHCGLTQFGGGGVHRRDIRIELVNGTVFYRRISDVQEIDEDTERFTLNASLGVLVTPADVRFICWMSLARLDADTMEIEWSHRGLAEAGISMRSPNNGA